MYLNCGFLVVPTSDNESIFLILLRQLVLDRAAAVAHYAAAVHFDNIIMFGPLSLEYKPSETIFSGVCRAALGQASRASLGACQWTLWIQKDY